MKYRQVLNKIGIDKAIFYTVVARLTQGVGGVFSLFFVATLLNGIEQGFYFTFASILAIQVFFELGLTEIIVQFVAHEKAHIVIDNQLIKGSRIHVSRLASLLRFCVKWYLFIALLLLISLMFVGFLYFGYFYKAEGQIEWRAPWLILCFTTSFYLIISPILAFIEGLGHVKEVAKFRFIQQIANMLVLWGGLICGFKLYVGGIAAFVGIIILVSFVLHRYSYLLHNIWKIPIVEIVDYRKEVFPYQWRIAVSWISGYFIFQLFNPVLFATAGPVVAGQMGMTLTALNAIMSLAFSWYSTKVPMFSNYIARAQIRELEQLFCTAQKQSAIVCFCLLFVMLIIVSLFQICDISINGVELKDKFLPVIPMLFMMVTIMLRVIYGGWATYIRCHKVEPFLLQSIITAVACLLSTFVLGNLYGMYGMTLGYMLLNFLIAFWVYKIYRKNKMKLHGK